MALPESLVELNRLVFNPIYRSFSWAIPPYAVVIVRQRDTGEVYPVPVQAYGGPGDSIIIGMTYGADRNWVLNLFASGGAQVWRKGRGTLYVNPRYKSAEEGYRYLPLPTTFMYKRFGTQQCLFLDCADEQATAA